MTYDTPNEFPHQFSRTFHNGCPEHLSTQWRRRRVQTPRVRNVLQNIWRRMRFHETYHRFSQRPRRANTLTGNICTVFGILQNRILRSYAASGATRVRNFSRSIQGPLRGAQCESHPIHRRANTHRGETNEACSEPRHAQKKRFAHHCRPFEY